MVHFRLNFISLPVEFNLTHIVHIEKKYSCLISTIKNVTKKKQNLEIFSKNK